MVVGSVRCLAAVLWYAVGVCMRFGAVFAQCRDGLMVGDWDCSVDSHEMLMFIEGGGCVKEMMFVEETFVLFR